MSTGPRSGPRSYQASLIGLLLVLLWIDTSHAQIISTQSALPARPVSTIAGLPACGAVQIGVTCNGTQWIVQ